VRDPSFYVSGLLELQNVSDPTERRAVWRQSMAALARAATEEGPGPLDGLHPDALVRGVRAAIANALIDDLDWLAPAAAGAALYALASALPLGPEQRDLGRRVLARLLAANAEAFVALSTRMALGAGKGLGAAPVRARIALVTELPISLGIPDGPLALALASRRELSREWIAQMSTGSLPARRLSARLLERAAREAARRASQGDSHALRAFSADAVKEAWKRLLADRESLVWRHVAVARGLLAPWVTELRTEIEGALSPKHTMTEWRRGATSIAAYVGVNAEAALRLAHGGIAQGAMARDPGIASAFVWGIPRAAEAEPDAAVELLDAVLERATPDVAEAVLELQTEFGDAPFVEKAFARALVLCRGRAAQSGSGKDDGSDALAREIMRDLERATEDDPPLRLQLQQALILFGSDGARAAYSRAKEMLVSANGEMDALDAVSRDDDGAEGRSGSIARRTSMVQLRDLDITLLERNVLADLLKLGSNIDHVRQQDEALDTLRERLSEWILARESAPLPQAATFVAAAKGAPGGKPGSASPSHPTLRLRRLRALLHLVDGDVGDADGDAGRAARLRKRWLRTAKALLGRFERDPPSLLRRTILAALARALDALVRAGACDVSDALLVVTRKMTEPSELDTLAEASMDPDLIHVLVRYARFVRAVTSPGPPVKPKGDSLMPASSAPVLDTMPSVALRLKAFDELAAELTPDASGRTEALRMVLVRVHSALSAVASAPSLRSLSSADGSDKDILGSLETALGALGQMANGARARLDPDRVAAAPLSGATSRPLSVAVSRVLSGAEPVLTDMALSASIDELLAGIPNAIAMICTDVIRDLADLPVDRASAESATVKVTDQQLPAWIPARRTIGGFYVLKSLGSGASGTVFVVTRVEERNESDAERFALKVPEYSATAARMISELEFSNMFRAEASALMAVPPHPNLARFVTFDVGAKPKPILVMELIEGSTLDRILESGALEMTRTLQILDDVLAGLEAMHEVGVGHLDLKPGNVVLRKGEEAVLVDFGLAGRHIRPGCATGPYGAPEVWGALPPDSTPTPTPADMYAFGCLAYETLTGKVLFDADNELAQIALHVSHDGFPPAVKALKSKPETAMLAELLHSALRREPKDRATASELREEMRAIGPKLGRVKWPLQV
jgi:hypothetical protein